LLPLLSWQPHGDDGVDDYDLFGTDACTGRSLEGGQQDANAADLLQSLALAIDAGNVGGGNESLHGLFEGETTAGLGANSMEVWAYPQASSNAHRSPSAAARAASFGGGGGGVGPPLPRAPALVQCAESAAEVVAKLDELLAMDSRIGNDRIGIEMGGAPEMWGSGGRGGGGAARVRRGRDHVVPDRADVCSICGTVGGDELFCSTCCSTYFNGAAAAEHAAAEPASAQPVRTESRASPGPALVPGSPLGADAVFTDDDDDDAASTDASYLVALDTFWTFEHGSKRSSSGSSSNKVRSSCMGGVNTPLPSPMKLPLAKMTAAAVQIQETACTCGGGMFCTCIDLPLPC